MAKDKKKDKAAAAEAKTAATPRERGSGTTSPATHAAVDSTNVGDLVAGTCALCGKPYDATRDAAMAASCYNGHRDGMHEACFERFLKRYTDGKCERRRRRRRRRRHTKKNAARARPC